MDLFTYLMAKNGNNTSIHEDLFSYLLGKAQGGGGEIKTATGITIYIPDAKKLVSFMMTKESTQETTTGKNLFDKDNVTIINAYLTGSQTWRLASDSRSFRFAIEPNTTYCISCNNPNETIFRVALTASENIPTEGNSVSTHDEVRYTNTNTPIVLTTNSTDKYIIIQFGQIQINTSIQTLQIEEGSTATAYEEYTGGQPSPNPDYPQEVKTVKGIENLLNVTTNLITNRTQNGITTKVNDDKSISFSGTASVRTRYFTSSDSDKIFFKAGTYTLCHNANFEIDIQIRKVDSNTRTTVTNTFTSTEDFYIYNGIFNLSNNTTYNQIIYLQIVEGDQKLPYVPYGNNYIYTKVVGKNLFDKNNANVLNAYIDTNGNILSATNGKSLYINCKSNTTYTVSRISGTRFRIVDTNVLPEIGIKGNNFVGVDTSTSLTITTSNNAKYLCVNYFNRNTDGDTEQEILDSIQIEEGSTATTYEAYQESIAPIPLNNNEIVGIGDYKDELKVDKSGHVFINKKTGKVVLNGSENISYYGKGNWNFRYIPTPSIIFDGSSNKEHLLSNYFTPKNSGVDEAIASYQGMIVFRYDLYKTGNVNDFKTWLSTHNTEVYYVLETPELIDLQTKVDLKLFEGVNNVSNSEDGYMTIEYK